MKIKQVNIKTEIVDSTLSPDEQQLYPQLLEAAREMAQKSYAPYSRFHVGAAVRFEDGEMLAGSNQENAAYPSGLCAERVTVFYANAKYPEKKITHLLIYAQTEDGGAVGQPITPCGACRQVLIEKENIQGAPIKIVLAGREVFYVLKSAADLMPLSFLPESLNGK